MLVGFSLISEFLNAALRFHLSHSTIRDQKDLLDGLGPLSTDSARIKLVRAMGWLPNLLSDGVESFRQFRNIVAHQIVLNSDIDILSKIPRPTKDFLDSKFSVIVKGYQDLEYDEDFTYEEPKTADPRAYALILALYTLETVICAPASLRLGLGVRIGGIYTSEEGPPWAMEAHAHCIHAVSTLWLTRK